MTQAQFNFEQSFKSDSSDIIVPTGTVHSIFVGFDGFFKCKDNAGIVEYVLTEDGKRIVCGVYPPIR